MDERSSRRSKVTIDLYVETREPTVEKHQQRIRWAYRNMLGTNADMPETFYLAAVRDETGLLLEFTGAGRGEPSPEMQDLVADLLKEKRSKS